MLRFSSTPFAIVLFVILTAGKAPLCGGGRALAADQTPIPPARTFQAMTFDEALGLAAVAPRVQAAASATQVKRRMNERISSLTQNPQIGAQAGYRFLRSSDRGLEFLFDVMQPWSLSGHAGARREAANLEADVLAAETRDTALLQRLGAARAWIELWGAEQVLAEAVREDAVAAELEARVEKAQSLGAVTRADLADARAFHAEIRALTIGARGEVFERGLMLARETGSHGSAPFVTGGALPNAPLPSIDEQRVMLDHVDLAPPVLVRAIAARAARAREAEEKAARGSFLSLGAVVQRDSPGGLVVSGAGRLYFPMFDRGERERGVLAAETERIKGEHQDAIVAARADLAFAIHEVEHSLELMTELRDDLVPAAREGAETRHRLFQAGSATVLEVLQADRVAITAASRLHRATAAHAWARVHLWTLLSAIAFGPQAKQ